MCQKSKQNMGKVKITMFCIKRINFAIFCDSRVNITVYIELKELIS